MVSVLLLFRAKLPAPPTIPEKFTAAVSESVKVKPVPRFRGPVKLRLLVPPMVELAVNWVRLDRERALPDARVPPLRVRLVVVRVLSSSNVPAVMVVKPRVLAFFNSR